MYPGSAAEAAGLVPGDWLLGVDGVTVNTIREFQDAVAIYEPGTAIAISVRDARGDGREVRATLGTKWIPAPRSIVG